MCGTGLLLQCLPRYYYYSVSLRYCFGHPALLVFSTPICKYNSVAACPQVNQLSPMKICLGRDLSSESTNELWSPWDHSSNMTPWILLKNTTYCCGLLIVDIQFCLHGLHPFFFAIPNVAAYQWLNQQLPWWTLFPVALVYAEYRIDEGDSQIL